MTGIRDSDPPLPKWGDVASATAVLDCPNRAAQPTPALRGNVGFFDDVFRDVCLLKSAYVCLHFAKME